MSRFQYIWEKHLLKSIPTNIVVGLSGGVDSMVLLDLLYHLPEKIRPTIFVVHINHHLRIESDEEEAFVREHVSKLKLPLEVYHWHPEAHPQTGIEEAARLKRYQIFEQVMKQTESTYLATAHHKSDQVETLLMRLIRGGRWQRMQGIAYKRPFGTGELIRPLLDFTKEELYDYAERHEVFFVEDASNQALDYTRNRYRHLIVPQLQKENPKMEEHVAQFAIDMQKVSKIVTDVIEKTLSDVTIDEGLTLIREDFLALPLEKREFVLEAWLSQLYADDKVEWGQSQIDEIIHWLQQKRPNSRLNLPGQKILVRMYNVVSLQDNKRIYKHSKNKTIELQLNDWTKLSDNEYFGFFDSEHLPPFLPEDKMIIVRKEDITLPLLLRHRKPGDRMSLKGRSGSKKVKDIFIDQKIPLEKRNAAWLLADDEETILWLIDYKESALSCAFEIDRIQYVFIYRNKELIK